jgi:hypothetical protein
MSHRINYEAYDYDLVTADNTAGGVALTAAKVTPVGEAYRADMVEISNVGTDPCTVNYTVDGTAPTTGVGHPIVNGQSLEIYAYRNISRFKAIRLATNSGLLRVTYYTNKGLN